MINNKIVAICGGSASGKTAVSEALYTRHLKDILLISQDSYYKSFDGLTMEEKKKINYDHPDAFDTQLLLANLARLKRGEKVENPIYSFSQYARTGTEEISPKPIILLEGMLILHYPEIRDIVDEAIYIHCPEDIRLKRMIERDVADRGRKPEWVIEQYYRDMKPMHEKYVEIQRKYADIVINSDMDFEKMYGMLERFLERKNILEDEYER